MEFGNLVGWGFLVLGSSTVLFSIPLVAGWVPMNKFGYGFPFSVAFESDAKWHAVNRFGGWVSIALGVVFMALGAMVVFGPPLPEFVPVLFTAIPAPLIVLAYVLVYFHSKRLKP